MSMSMGSIMLLWIVNLLLCCAGSGTRLACEAVASMSGSIKSLACSLGNTLDTMSWILLLTSFCLHQIRHQLCHPQLHAQPQAQAREQAQAEAQAEALAQAQEQARAHVQAGEQESEVVEVQAREEGQAQAELGVQAQAKAESRRKAKTEAEAQGLGACGWSGDVERLCAQQDMNSVCGTSWLRTPGSFTHFVAFSESNATWPPDIISVPHDQVQAFCDKGKCSIVKVMHWPQGTT